MIKLTKTNEKELINVFCFCLAEDSEEEQNDDYPEEDNTFEEETSDVDEEYNLGRNMMWPNG